jgi:hypothetical protein
MDAYMYHMLLRSREVWLYNKAISGDTDEELLWEPCPFCEADTLETARKEICSPRPRHPDCGACPLLNYSLEGEKVDMITMSCVPFGRKLLRNYEESDHDSKNYSSDL